MQVPGVLVALQNQGVIDRVVRPLKSGKEAEVFLVESEGELRVAKVYKSMHRSFKQRSLYTEGRKVRNTRDQRAIDRRTRHGKQQEEEAWKSAEVDIIHRLHAAGVRVPTPYNFIDGVLIMELVKDGDGDVAPRLAEVDLDSETANAYYQQLLREVVRMLCAGVIHGDLSDYNVLVDASGPVVIDFPQSVDSAANRNAKTLLLRDVDNLGHFLTRVVPGTRLRHYGQEIWAAFENNQLSADMKLTGDFRRSSKKTDVSDVLGLIGEADEDEKVRRGEVRRGRGRGGAPREGGREGGRGEATKDARPPRSESRGESPRSEPRRESPRSESPRPEPSRDAPRYRRMQVVETAAPSAKKKDEPRPRPPRRRSEGAPSAGGAREAEGAAPKRRRRRRRRGNAEGASGEVAPKGAAAEPRRRDGRSDGHGEGRRPETGSSESRAGEGRDSRRSDTRSREGSPSGQGVQGAQGKGESGDAPRRRRRRRRGPKPE